MSEKKYVVPKGMLKAANREVYVGGIQQDCYELILMRGLEAAVKWMAENPIVPTPQQASKIWDDARAGDPKYTERACVEWQKIMYLGPEDPFERDCADIVPTVAEVLTLRRVELDMREAYERGRKAK